MSDDLVKWLRGLVECQVGDVPVLIHEAADRIEALAAKLAEVEAERDVAKSHIHKLAHDGDQFAAFMHPLDSDARKIHLSEYRKWRKSVNDAWAAVFTNEGYKMSDDLVKRADGFRLSVDPTPDDVNEANWLIDRLTAKLAEVEAERDKCMDNLEAALDQRDVADARAEAAEAAIPRAYAMALETAAVVAVDYGKIQYSANIQHQPQYANDAADDAIEIANAIRAMTPPADLVELVLKTKETDT